MSKLNGQGLARAQIITAMVFFGTIGVFVKNIDLASSEIALYRAVIAAAVLLVVLLVTGRLKKLGLMKKQLPILFFSGWQWASTGYYYSKHIITPALLSLLCVIISHLHL